jgi:hypothetical protein
LQNPYSTAIDSFLRVGPIVLVSNVQRCKISQLRFGVAGHLLETLVRRQIPSVFKIECGDGDRGGLERGSPTLLAGAQRRFRPLAAGDIDDDPSKEKPVFFPSPKP